MNNIFSFVLSLCGWNHTLGAGLYSELRRTPGRCRASWTSSIARRVSLSIRDVDPRCQSIAADRCFSNYDRQLLWLTRCTFC